MTGREELALEIEDLIRRFGLVQVVDTVGAICTERAQRIGATLRAQREAGGLSGLLRGLGEYVLRRERERP